MPGGLIVSAGARKSPGSEGRIIMLAPTPPVGWNSWNTFGGDINEEVVQQTADAFLDVGLRDAGYAYVVIDDCWSLKQRGPDGRSTATPTSSPPA